MFHITPRGDSCTRTRGRRPPWQRERRLVVRFLVLAALVGGLMTSGVLGSQRGAGLWVSVAQGQSLWSIASRHYPQTDPRQAVYDIKTANHLQTDYIYPGERLLLPAE